MRSLALAFLLFTMPAHAAPPESPAVPVLQKAMQSPTDAAVLTSTLAEVDALIAKAPKDPLAHYARGWILSRQNKPADAVAAYDKAFSLDATFADAAYNAGVVLGSNGKPKDAVVRFDRALAAAPKHTDAAYNAGQGYYDLGDFTKAAARWETAAALAPDDFQIAKKLVQAYVGAGKADKVKTARDKVFAMWKAGKVPGKAKDYVYDQFKVGAYHVYMHETFDTSGSLAYVFTARVTKDEKVIGSVNLETSAVIREQGVPYVVGINQGNKHTTLNEYAFKQLPEYAAWKAIAQKVIAQKF